MAKEGYNSITIDEDTLNKLKEIQTINGYKTIPETIRAILNNQSDVDFKINLLMQLVNSDKNPFAYLLLEENATREQQSAIFDLMDKTEKKIRTKEKVSHVAFETEIYRIFPKSYGDYHFAENIVATLGEKGRWETVYKFMKKDGMNIK